ncbi:MAG TPA: hypothetical protein PKL04_11310, partial [Methanofastidiosum sp.]|nr:hypothetical protein [Methanofastidiosum sp.]
MDLLTKFFRSVMSDKTNLIELFQHNRPSLQDVEYALSQGADVNAVNSEGAPVLALAAQTKNP